jgi:nicotinamide-nucleotide amidase
MRAKIISIGDEILIGQIINSNASYISGKLYKIGIPVERVITIGDNQKDLINELKDSVKYFNVTIITGGLGPTHDDITKPVLVKYFKDKLVLNKKVLEQVSRIFKSRNIKMPEANINQAMVPLKAKVIWNNCGTAPGILYKNEKKIIIALPGVPFEMKEMIDKEVIPYIRKNFLKLTGLKLRSKTILTTGITESELFEKLGDISKLTGGEKLAFLPSASGVRLRIDVKGKTKYELSQKIKKIENNIKKKAGGYIYGEEDDRLEEIVGRILIKRGLTLSTAESCTGGLLSSRITDVSGSSKYFLGGIISYSNKSKIDILKVKSTTIEKFGAVSVETAKEMALGIRKVFNSDIGISTTGIAGPTGGTKSKPVGLVWIGYSDEKNNYTKRFFFGNIRERTKIRASMMALEILRYNLTLQI